MHLRRCSGACLLASCRSGGSVYSWLGRAPVADRRGQQPGRAVGTAHRDRNAVVEVQSGERGRPARRRRRWRVIRRRAGDWHGVPGTSRAIACFRLAL